MRRKIFFFVILLCLIAFVGCSYPMEELDRISEIDLEETYPEIPMDLEVVYEDLEEIVDDATAIVQVMVRDVSHSVLLQTPPLKETKVSIVEVYKGDLVAGKDMYIYEVDQGNETVLGGIPYMNNRERFFLFLDSYEEKYYVCGAFQGRFIIREDYVFQQATEDYKLNSYTPVTVQEFEELIQYYIDENEEES